MVSAATDLKTPPFIFNNSAKNQLILIILVYDILTKVDTSPIKCCRTTLRSAKQWVFWKYTTLILNKQLISFFLISKHFRNIQHLKKSKMSLTSSLHYSECSKCTNTSIYITVTTRSTMHRCNAVHLWNRRYCNSGRIMSLLNTYCNVD